MNQSVMQTILKSDYAFDEVAPPKPVYTHTVESKVWRVCKDIISVLIPIIGLYRLVHRLVSLATLPACMANAQWAALYRNYYVSQLDSEWTMKRIAVQVDGYTIDAMIVGKESTFSNGRWVLQSIGNGEYYEDALNPEVDSFRNILTQLEGNALIFNYPGVASSSGMPSRTAMRKAYLAMLNFLEDQEEGIGAKEIIGYGHSIGGAVQGEALRSHPLKNGVQYVFVKSRTFSNLYRETSFLIHPILGFLLKAFGWNMSSITSSRRLQAPEIIMQTGDATANPKELTDKDKVFCDGIIGKKASLAYQLLKDRENSALTCGDKYFMGISEFHNEGLKKSTVEHLVSKIQEFLKKKND